jgi:hypothetical protein
MSDLHVHSTREKCYVEHPEFGCIARLCKFSAEYYTVAEEVFASAGVVFGSSFGAFQIRCREMYGIDISSDYKPIVFKD